MRTNKQIISSNITKLKMELLCKVCVRSIIEDGRYSDFTTSFRKRIDNSLCINYATKNVILDEDDKILNSYVSTHNKNFDFYIIYCDCLIEFDNKFTTNVTTHYIYNTDITKLYEYSLHELNFHKTRGYNVSNINQIAIKTTKDKCNMSFKHYVDQPMSMCERKINMNVAENPELINSLDRDKNHPLIRKYSHVPI